MYKILSVLLSAILVFSLPVYCFADEEETAETLPETVESISQEEIQEETTAYFEETSEEENEYNLNYWIVPMSEQIKIAWNNDFDYIKVGIYISDDNENFEYVGETSDNYYIINELTHRKKYFVRLVAQTEGDEIIAPSQSIRVK